MNMRFCSCYFVCRRLITVSPFIFFTIFVLFLTVMPSQAAVLDDPGKHDRVRAIYLGYAAGITAGYAGFYHLWYKQNGFERFSFQNDNRHWQQMDKAGHLMTAFQLGEFGIQIMRWAGAGEDRAIWHGGLSGLLFLTGMEIFDGFSTGYGFSWGDQLANVAGTALVTGQELLWREQRFRIKYSFYSSSYAGYRPELLGKNLLETLVKDYNGQTYWLSFSARSFSENIRLPDWLCISFGYSAGGMTGGYSNPSLNSAGRPIPDFNRYRQYFLSLDVDLSRVRTESRLLQTVFSAVGFIKFPFSALEYNTDDGFRFKPVHF
jgi:uncharacterized protein YfiM (DUF2279 family)